MEAPDLVLWTKVCSMVIEYVHWIFNMSKQGERERETEENHIMRIEKLLFWFHNSHHSNKFHKFYIDRTFSEMSKPI